MKWLPLAIAGAVGLIAGVGVTIWLQDEPDNSTATLEAAPVTTAAVPPADEQVLLAWTSDGLPPGLADGVRALPGVTRVTVVQADLAEMTASYDAQGRTVDRTAPGYVIPLDVLAIDPETYPAFFDRGDRDELRELGPGEALLGRTSAELRGIGPGGAIELSNGTQLTVAGVVDDQVVGAAEAVVRTDTAEAAGVSTERFVLVAHDGPRAQLDPAIAALAPDKSVRFRTRIETPYLRHADAVLPQVFMKERFGEFSYRADSGDYIDVDPAWIDENIQSAAVPILGEIQCHRAILPLVHAAMEELEQRNLAYLIDLAGYQGCFVPSLIPIDRAPGEPSSGPSRHSWGVALDLNFSQSPTGLTSAVDPRLVEVMERHGFRSGAEWIVPDPGHFEYYVAPTR